MSAGTDDRDKGFLARWSRRKREVVEDEPKPVEPVPVTAAGAVQSPAGEAVVPEPEMVEPPSLDLIDKDFDLAHWLKQNVPESWKLAALRRAWLADPTIRNFENPARDYALDWNTPGGAPGYGPLTESDDVGAMVRQIFGEDPEPQPAPAAAADATAEIGDSMPHRLSSKEESDISDAASQQNPAPPEPVSVRRSADDGKGDQNMSDNLPKSSDVTLAALQENSTRKAEPVRIRKRGGGAIPM